MLMILLRVLNKSIQFKSKNFVSGGGLSYKLFLNYKFSDITVESKAFVKEYCCFVYKTAYLLKKNLCIYFWPSIADINHVTFTVLHTKRQLWVLIMYLLPFPEV